MGKVFTFHYELIITKTEVELKQRLKEFTFHYELIITYSYLVCTGI